MKKFKFCFLVLIVILNLNISFALSKERIFSKEIASQLPVIKIPLNHNDSFELYRDDLLKRIPIDFKVFLNIPEEVDDILGAGLPSIIHGVNPLFIDAIRESGEADLYIYIFSDDYKVIDKLLVFSYRTTTRGGPGGSGQAVGYRYFTMDENYFIERRQRFEDETMEVQHFQVTKEGKFQELPVSSSCYSQLAIKDNKKHSTKSLLLTDKQANNYMRSKSERLNELDSITLTLNPNEKKLCVNYQQVYSVSFGKISSRQLFGDEKIYQQQAENFKKYNVDISNDLKYIEFKNIEQTPLAKFLLNGNRAIYMNDMLFIVGKNYFVAYRQPTVNELTYQEKDYYDESKNVN